MSAVYLFGSYAWGGATDKSDVDILINRTGSSVRSLFAMGGLYNNLRDCIGKKAELVTTHAIDAG